VVQRTPTPNLEKQATTIAEWGVIHRVLGHGYVVTSKLIRAQAKTNAQGVRMGANEIDLPGRTVPNGKSPRTDRVAYWALSAIEGI
jgi:hypothetical protein